jgi:hypothetical protein
VTRYDFFRRRVAPVLFLCMVGVIVFDAWRTEKQNEGIKGTVVIELGEAEPRVKELEAELIVNGESISTFRKPALPGSLIGEIKFEAQMPASDGELRFAIDLGDERRRLTRSVHLKDGGTIKIDLSRDLARR